MTFEEIKKAIEDNNITLEQFAYGDFGTGRDNFITEVGTSKEVERYGGEDKGSEWYSVRYFPEHNVYIRLDGYYSSYNGADFEGSELIEVFPTKVTRLEYIPYQK